jgi:hypothetical protein
MKIRPMGADLFRAAKQIEAWTDGRTDEQTQPS